MHSFGEAKNKCKAKRSTNKNWERRNWNEKYIEIWKSGTAPSASVVWWSFSVCSAYYFNVFEFHIWNWLYTPMPSIRIFCPHVCECLCAQVAAPMGQIDMNVILFVFFFFTFFCSSFSLLCQSRLLWVKRELFLLLFSSCFFFFFINIFRWRSFVCSVLFGVCAFAIAHPRLCFTLKILFAELTQKVRFEFTKWRMFGLQMSKNQKKMACDNHEGVPIYSTVKSTLSHLARCT